MRQFIIDHLPLVVANWLSIGIGLTDRRGNNGPGLGGNSSVASTAGQPIGLLLVLTKAS